MKLTDRQKKIAFCIMAPVAFCGIVLALDGELFWSSLIALALALTSFITDGEL